MGKLPGFIVIGATKSGTTSLHEYLSQHPQISLPQKKETHFFIFDREADNHPSEYFGMLPKKPIYDISDYLEEFQNKETALYYGEVCPSYLFFPNTAANIFRRIPDAKIICILRNPVDRLYSSFIFNNRNNTYDKFIELTNQLPEINPENLSFLRFLKGGLYYEQLLRYYALFPKNQIKILLFDDLLKDPISLMEDLLQFLEIPGYSFNTSEKFNISGKTRWGWLKKVKIKRKVFMNILRKVLPYPLYQKTRSYIERLVFVRPSKLPPEIKRKILNYYRDDILKLEKLTEINFNLWLD